MQPIVHLLLETLDTPSQPVQEAIAKCLPPLISFIKLQAANLIETLLNKVCCYYSLYLMYYRMVQNFDGGKY